MPLPTDTPTEAERLLKLALHLRMYGECAPGGHETWAQFDTDLECHLRGLPRPEPRKHDCPRERPVLNDQPMPATTPTEAQDTTPTEPTGHDEAVSFYAAGTTFRIAKDADPKTAIAYLAAKAARGVTANIGQRDENIAEAVVAWLDAAGLLATEQEWRVVHPHPVNLDAVGETWTERESAEQAANYARSGYGIQSRRVTAWTEVDA